MYNRLKKNSAKRWVAWLLAISMIFVYGGFTPKSYAEEFKYHIQLATTGVMAPSATKSPVDLKEGQMVNMGAEVADEKGVEVTVEDPDFGDDIPVYQDILWTPEDDGIIVSDANKTSTHKTVKGVKAGTHYINLTYKGKDESKIKPLKIQVNVTKSDSVEKPKTVKLKPESIDDTLIVGTEKDYKITGEDAVGQPTVPSLSIKSLSQKGIIEAAAKGDVLHIKALSEGKVFVRIEDKDGQIKSYSFTVKDNSPWIFDKSTGTLNGLKDPDNKEALVIPEKIDGVAVKKIGKEAFRYSENTYGKPKKLNRPLTSLTLPEGLEETDYMSFQGNKLTSVTLPKSLKVLGERTFFMNDGLKDVKFGDGGRLETIGSDALGNTSLESLDMPDTVVNIGSGAFSGTPLKSLKIGNNVKEIGAGAFANAMMEEFTVPDKAEKLGLNARGKAGNGIFFRNFKDKTKPTGFEGTLRFTKVYDKTGKANLENTCAVVNPVPVTLKFVDEKGKEIASSKQAVGFEKKKIVKKAGRYGEVSDIGDGDGHYYTDYLNPFSETKIYTDKKFRDAIIGENYFTDGKAYDFTAPEIDGYITPSNINKTVKTGDSEVVFVYKEAEKLNLKLEGEGLFAEPAAGAVSKGKPVKVKVVEPDGKSLAKLSVNGKDVTKDAKFNGIFYDYSFKMNEDTTVKAEYVKSDRKNVLTLKIDKDKLKLGDTSSVSVFYRGEKINADSDRLVWAYDTARAFKLIKDKEELKAMEAGTHNVFVQVKDMPDIKAEGQVIVSPVPVTVRFEDDDHRVTVAKNAVVDKLYFTKGVDYYEDVEFDAPVPVLAFAKVLKEKGENITDKSVFDCNPDGNWIKNLGSGWTNMNKDGSFMFTVNDVYANKGAGQFVINDNDRICVFYDPNWMDQSGISYFTKENYVIKAGETVDFTLMSAKMSNGMDGGNVDVKPQEDAILEVTHDNKTVLTDFVTDKDGKVSYKFDEPGTYYVAAISVLKPASYARSYAVVTVEKDGGSKPPVEPEPVNPGPVKPEPVGPAPVPAPVPAPGDGSSIKLPSNMPKAKTVPTTGDESGEYMLMMMAAVAATWAISFRFRKKRKADR